MVCQPFFQKKLEDFRKTVIKKERKQAVKMFSTTLNILEEEFLMKYNPHKSSLFDLDANIVALLIYLIPFLLGFVSESLSTIAWILPLLAFIMEKDSDFVVFHASNSLAFYAIEALIYIISSALGISAAIAGWFANIAIVGILGAGLVGLIILFIGIGMLLVEIYLFVGNILGLVKAYNYEELHMPIVITITRFIQTLKR